MITRLRACLIATLLWAAPLAAQAPPESPPLPAADSEAIAIGRDRDDRMTVPVTIAGQGPFRFLIDTGAQATVVTRTLSERLGLPAAGSATLIGMASEAQVDLVTLNGLAFASRTFDNISAPLLEARHIGADGILGLDSLQDLRVLIDFRADSIRVDDAHELGGDKGYEIVVRARRKLGRLIITEARIDGVATAIIIDTGSQGSIGNSALARRLRASRRETERSTDVNGIEMIAHVDMVRTLQLGGVELNNFAVSFSDAPAFRALGLGHRPALILGMRDLSVFDRVAIDFASSKILFDVPADIRTGRAADWDRAGSSL